MNFFDNFHVEFKQLIDFGVTIWESAGLLPYFERTKI